MGIDFGYWDMGTDILRTIAKVAGYGIKGGRAIYARHQIKEDEYQYQAYERAAKNPPAPDALQHYTRSGVFFGKQGYKYIRKPQDMDGHVLVIGGTGSGKTTCIAIPTLRAWGGRFFTIDIKGELEAKTYRGRLTKVFNPLKSDSYGYDPYYALKNSRNPSQEAKAIAQALVPRPPDIKDPFWVESAQNLLTGAILHFYHEGYTFIETLQTIQKTPSNALVEEIAQSKTREAVYYINNFIGMADKTLSGVVSELSRNIVTIAADKQLVAALSNKKKVIAPADLESGWNIYIQIPEHLLYQWNPVITLIVNQFLSYFEQRSNYNTTPILFLLDEFPRLGRIPTIQNGLATLRSRRVTLCVIQNIAQLSAIYGRDNANVILGNCDYKAVLGASDYDTQRYLSALCVCTSNAWGARGISSHYL